MNKKELRKTYKLKRMQLSVEETGALTAAMLQRFGQFVWPPVHNLFAYTALEIMNEPATQPFINHLLQTNPGCRVAYPVTDFAAATMTAVIPNHPAQWHANEYGIPEPAGGGPMAPGSIDMLLVPLLAADVKGNRVGYGKGFYDRYLAQCRKDCIRAGLSFFEPEPLIEGLNDFDVPLTHCITPTQVYVF